ncbi:unnamed protein product [Mytilus coruscus]|uniref:AIG1-type G domain-containing protein n=1 Tax=Mytilus coruscus TaxID=42192 RepID=A0A6J8A7V6_MYTCO|nr:unnamed protein product [Mytilus coruscus]
MFKHAIVVFTNLDVWKDRFKDDNGQEPDDHRYVRTLPQDSMNLLKKCGGRYVLFDNKCTGDEMEKQLRNLLDEIAKMIALNKEEVYTEEMMTDRKDQENDMSLRQGNDWIIKTGFSAGICAAVGFFTNQEIRIILLGPSGSGKSRTGNNLGKLTPAFKVGNRGRPVTVNCESATVERFGKRLRIIDTPGIWGDEKEKKELLNEIIKSLQMACEGPHVFLLVVEMGRAVEILLRYQYLFGEKMFKYSIVLFTNFDVWRDRSKDDNDQDPDVHQYLINLPKDAKDILNKCSWRYAVLDNRSIGEDMEGHLRNLMEKIKDLVTENNEEFYTEEKIENYTREKNEKSTEQHDSSPRRKIKG